MKVYKTPFNLDMSRFDLIGFDRMFDMLSSLNHPYTDGYPPLNVVKIDDDNFRVELAVAGFSRKDITVTQSANRLEIVGKKEEESQDEMSNYLHKGIGSRKFERAFVLADYVKVSEARLRDGILEVCLKRELPKKMQPREIEIS